MQKTKEVSPSFGGTSHCQFWLHPTAWFWVENWPKPEGAMRRQLAGEVGVGPGVLVHVAVAVAVAVSVAVGVAVEVNVKVEVLVTVGVNAAHIPAVHDALKTGKQPGPHAPPAGAPQERNGGFPH